MLDSAPDQEIVRRCLGGESDVYRLLVRRYQARTFSFLVKMLRQRELAEELAQEAFFQAYSRLDSCREPERYFLWLLKIARNLALNTVRQGRVTTVPLDSVLEGPKLWDMHSVGDGSAQGRLESRETALELERRVLSLPPIYRSAVILRHQESLSYQEIAGVLEIPVGTVKFRLHRAYRLLKERLFKR